jgi:hypothetical protein
MLQGRSKQKKKRQEVDTQSQTVISLALDQIIKFIYLLDWSLGEVNV